MRTSLTLLSGLFVLLFSFSSCLEEENATTFIPGPELENALGTMSYRGVESPIVAAYDMGGMITNPENGAVNQITIILANANMMGPNNRLTGTADALILNVIKDGSDVTGTYSPSDWNSPNNNAQFFSNICTGINFATGAMDDDEGMESGQTIISDNDDGTYTIEFSLQTYNNNTVSGSWTGELTPAVN